jgi:hypothetical protein
VAFKIAPRSKKIAKALGLELEPSKVGFKKIAVFRNGKKIADIGDRRYLDYHSYKKQYGTATAEARRMVYKQRHQNDLKSGKGKLAWLLLWN